jgi:hypothetical protein
MLTFLLGTIAFCRNKQGLARAISRIFGVVATMHAAFDEMQNMRRAAHKRHPFIEM